MKYTKDPFTGIHMIWLLIAAIFILAGHILMIAGEENIYGAVQITVAPLVLLTGYLLVIPAILKK